MNEMNVKYDVERYDILIRNKMFRILRLLKYSQPKQCN